MVIKVIVRGRKWSIKSLRKHYPLSPQSRILGPLTMSIKIKRCRVIPAKHAVPRFEASMMADGRVWGQNNERPGPCRQQQPGLSLNRGNNSVAHDDHTHHWEKQTVGSICCTWRENTTVKCRFLKHDLHKRCILREVANIVPAVGDFLTQEREHWKKVSSAILLHTPQAGGR